MLGSLCVQVLAMILGGAISAWAADPTIGTWRLNVAKSEFSPGPAFKSEVRTYEESPEGVQVRIRTIEADGHSVTIEYSANYDGKYYPVSGSGGPADAIAHEDQRSRGGLDADAWQHHNRDGPTRCLKEWQNYDDQL